MKTTIQILVFAIIFTFTACKNSGDVQPSYTFNSNAPMTGQVWKVGYFGDSRNDETHKFSGYTFRFLENSVVSISSPEGSFEGTWNITGDSGSDRFRLNTSGNYQMTEITIDWLLIEKSSTLVWLGDDNPESAETLKFVQP